MKLKQFKTLIRLLLWNPILIISIEVKKEYINTGKCIWCGKEKPVVSFHTAPHIVPKCLGGVEIGTDICDDCNHAFGTVVQGSPSVDAMFHEQQELCPDVMIMKLKEEACVNFRELMLILFSMWPNCVNSEIDLHQDCR